MGGETADGRWALTSTALQSLLARLDENPERAGEKYEELRRRLVWFFEIRGSWEPEAHTDEAINRLTRRLQEGEPILNLTAYAHGVARMLLLEARRRQQRQKIGEEAFATTRSAMEEEADARLPCLDDCLNTLPADERTLVLEYYREDGGGGGRIDARRVLAHRLDIPSAALRARVFRIRERLEACIGKCLKRPRDAAPLSVEPSGPGDAEAHGTSH